MNREAVIEELVSRIKAINGKNTIKIAIDGFMASGKTSLAKEISAKLESENIVVLQASADDFFNPEEIRYSRGFESAIGCYEDTFDLERLKSFLIKPLNRDGKLIDIIIFEGLFLQRPELVQFWDYIIFLVVNPDIALDRAAERDADRFENLDDLLYKHRVRYTPAQDLYVSEVGPHRKANCVINNDCLHHPRIIFNGQVSS